MRYLLIAFSLLLFQVPSAQAQVSVNIGMPGVNIGINVPAYPRLVRVPGYPVYYDPRANWNYFFYDGLYWVYQGDNWYASDWYNGPWQLVAPFDVPLFVLRVPVRYYRHRPEYFRGWGANASPRWGEHWGRDWETRRSGWDRWDRRSVPRPAPLPVYQRQYSGDRYPRAVEQRQSIRSENYRYQPREAVTQQHFGAPPVRAREHQAAPPVRARESQAAPQERAREKKAAPQERAREHQAAPQERARESKSAPQERARESQPAPQQRAREKKPAPEEKGKEKKHEERGQDRQ